MSHNEHSELKIYDCGELSSANLGPSKCSSSNNFINSKLQNSSDNEFFCNSKTFADKLLVNVCKLRLVVVRVMCRTLLSSEIPQNS